MAVERTFSMIKPDATRRNLTGAVTKMLEDAGLRVVASRRVWMSRREAEGFEGVAPGELKHPADPAHEQELDEIDHGVKAEVFVAVCVVWDEVGHIEEQNHQQIDQQEQDHKAPGSSPQEQQRE